MPRLRAAGVQTDAGVEGPARRSPVAGAWDCHVHLFGPASTYPFAKARAYTPPDARPEDLERMVSALGVERFVLVQPSPYGGDNRRLLDALRIFGEHARGVVALPTAPFGLQRLQEWHALGVRGIRINLASGGSGPGELEQALPIAADAAREVGWHVELHVAAGALSRLRFLIRHCSVPVVLDHFGRVRAGTRHERADLDVLLRLLDGGDVWIKLSASYRLADQGGAGPADVARVARALVGANPERLVWGSDWPHTGPHAGAAEPGAGILAFRRIDPATQLDLLHQFAPDTATRTRILCTNPEVIYQ